MSTCLTPGSENLDKVVCQNCSSEESKNYCDFLTITPLMEDEMIISSTVINKTNNSDVWKEWLLSVSEDIDALDVYDANEIFVKVKQYYRTLITDLYNRKTVNVNKEKTPEDVWRNLNVHSAYKIMVDEEHEEEQYFKNITIK